MIEFRKFLLFLRRKKTECKSLQSLYLQIGAIAMGAIIVGVVLDIVLPYNVIFNTIRAAVALIIGASIFSFGYIISVIISDKKTKDDYTPIRMRFSYIQRRNISIIACAPLLIIAFMFASYQSVIYTFISSLIVASIITLAAFMRRSRTEEIKKAYSIPDSRDVKFEKDIKEKIQAQVDKRNEARKKKESDK